MRDPISWTAILGIKGLLEGITAAAGYYTDLGLKPIRLDRMQREITDAETMVVEDAFDPKTSTRRQANFDIDVVIEHAVAVTQDGEAAELTAHRARADIVARLTLSLRGTLPQGIRKIDVIDAVIIGATTPGTPLVVAQVTVRAGLTETIPHA